MPYSSKRTGHGMDTTAEARRRELAGVLGYLTAEAFRELCGIEESTEVAWRKRGKGPPYVLIGTQYLYPRDAVTTFLNARVREPRNVRAKDVL